MGGFLFDQIIFGPVKSRRLGLSLGINLLPVDFKYCSFNCVYCECGWTKINAIDKLVFPPAVVVKQYLEKKLNELKAQNIVPDAITFAGNGEPTLHPDFAEIIDDTIKVRNAIFPQAKVTVLSNSTMLHLSDVVSALKKADIAMLKLDAGNEKTFALINKPLVDITLNEIIENMKQFNGNFIVQSIFIKGKFGEILIDNTGDKEIEAWIQQLKILKPQKVVIYPVQRATPSEVIEVVSLETLNRIAEKLTQAGLKSEVYY